LDEEIKTDKSISRKKQDKHTAITKKCKFKHTKLDIDLFKWITTDCYKIRKKNNKSIVVLHIRNTK